MVITICSCLATPGCFYQHPLVGIYGLEEDEDSDLFLLGLLATQAATSNGDDSSTSSSVPITSNLELYFNLTGISLSDGATASSLQNSASSGYAFSSSTWPTYRSAAFNGHPALQFTGSEYIDVDVSGMVYNGVTVAIALYSDSAGDGSGIVEHRNGTSTGSWALLQCSPGSWGCPAGGIRTEAIGGALYDTPNVSDQFIVFVYGNDPGVATNVYCNGTQLSNVSGPFSVVNTGNDIVIGRRYDGGVPFIGYIAEIAIYNRYLSDAERNTVDSYMSSKFGIALSGC